MEQNDITYNCKASVYTPLTMVGILMGVGMPLMFLGVFIHPIVGGVLMVASMYFMMMTMTGQAVFSMNAMGIQRAISTSIKLGKNKEPKKEFQNWDHLKWYKEGKDRGRYTAEYRFLQLHFKNGSEWMITDNNGARFEEFRTFLTSFELLVAEHNRQAVPAHSNTGTVSTQSQPAENIIKQRKTFYETIWAKMFTLLLGGFIVGFLYLQFTTNYIKGTSIFKLYVILIPGFVYMWYRVFREKK